MEIGLIGAGLMGFGMGASLLRRGHRLTTIAHRNRAPVERLVALGASEAASIEEAWLRRCAALAVTALPRGA